MRQLFFLVSCFLFSFHAQALEIGVHYVKFDYEEPDVMTEEGYLPGAYAHHSFRASKYWSLELDGEFSFGELDYSGSLVNLQTGDETPATSTTEDTLLNLRALCLTPPGEGFNLAVGLGYRLWQDEILGAGGYTRRTKYLYLPLGFQWETSDLLPSTDFTFEALYHQWIQGKNKSYLSEASSSLGDHEFDQNTGSGFSFKVHTVTKLQSDFDLGMSLFYRYWDVEDSTVSGGFFEPENNTQALGLRLGFSFPKL